MKIDFHLHTFYSDGILSPQSLVELAFQKGVRLFAITDHDCLDALPLAEESAKPLGMFLVSGVELNTEWDGQEVHILGYDFNRTDKVLEQKLSEQREYRKLRLKEMFLKLKDLGFKLDENRIYELAGKGAVGRPHLALALLEKKYVATVGEAFQKYLGYGKAAWVPRTHFTPQQAITAIRDAGGITALAHPGRGGKSVLPKLVEFGLQGLEVYYPSHSPTLTQELIALTKKFNLLATIGSDYHGINAGEKGPGCVDAPREVIDSWTRILVARGHEIRL